jgi:hypothetical protein
MPIRGDRLRWPPRPGKRSDAAPSNSRRAMLGSARSPTVKQELEAAKSNREDALGGETSSPREPVQNEGEDGDR